MRAGAARGVGRRWSGSRQDGPTWRQGRASSAPKGKLSETGVHRRTSRLSKMLPPDAPFEPKPYHYAEAALMQDEEWWTLELGDCQCPAIRHGWEGCQNGLPPEDHWRGVRLVCETCLEC